LERIVTPKLVLAGGIKRYEVVEECVEDGELREFVEI
jgi:hypothetical protein